jgi:hypothetical protein
VPSKTWMVKAFHIKFRFFTFYSVSFFLHLVLHDVSRNDMDPDHFIRDDRHTAAGGGADCNISAKVLGKTGGTPASITAISVGLEERDRNGD